MPDRQRTVGGPGDAPGREEHQGPHLRREHRRPALAYWLDRAGCAVTVVEKAPRPRPGGQAVDFKGATHRTVLERMGILEEGAQAADRRPRSVGAYVLAGELAHGDHRVAFQRYEDQLRAYVRVTRVGNAGPFLAPGAKLKMRMRNWAFKSAFLLRLMLKMTDRFATGVDLKDYPSLTNPPT